MESAANRAKLRAIEDRILGLLSGDDQGALLDNSKAVDALTESKGLADEVMEKQKAAVVTEARIDTAREVYSPVARVGASLFFSVSDVGRRLPFCQWPLQWLEGRLLEALKVTREKEAKQKKIREDAERQARRLARGRSAGSASDADEEEYDSEEEYAREHAGPAHDDAEREIDFDREIA